MITTGEEMITAEEAITGADEDLTTKEDINSLAVDTTFINVVINSLVET